MFWQLVPITGAESYDVFNFTFINILSAKTHLNSEKQTILRPLVNY